MSQSFHINKHGLPALCNANTHSCPLGEGTIHMTANSPEEAMEKFQEKMEKECSYDKIFSHVESKPEETKSYPISEKRKQRNQEYEDRFPQTSQKVQDIGGAVNTARRATIDLIGHASNPKSGQWEKANALAKSKEMFENNCYLCGGKLTFRDPTTADHVVPPRAGGYGGAGNLIRAHKSCNELKRNKSIDKFFEERIMIGELSPAWVEKQKEKIQRFADEFDFKPLPKNTWTEIERSITKKSVENWAKGLCPCRNH